MSAWLCPPSKSGGVEAGFAAILWWRRAVSEQTARFQVFSRTTLVQKDHVLGAFGRALSKRLVAAGHPSITPLSFRAASLGQKLPLGSLRERRARYPRPG
jgi:hypothetical protein